MNGELECRMQERAGGPGGAPSWTVGDLMKIDCPTDRFSLNPSHLKLVTKVPYQLQLLKAEIQPDGRLQLLATSYQVGEYKGEDISLSDGLETLKLKGLQFKVESVIDKSNPPKGPFGPVGGYVLGLPGFYLWSLLGVLCLALLLGVFKGLRRWQRQKLMASLKKHDSRLGPQTQLHVRFRQLDRQRFLEGGENSKYLKEVEDILRLFLIRQFKIPAYDWSDRLVLKEFRQRFAFLGEERAKDLMVLLRETRKIQLRTDFQIKDLETLVRKIKRWADQVDLSTGAHGAGRWESR